MARQVMEIADEGGGNEKYGHSTRLASKRTHPIQSVDTTNAAGGENCTAHARPGVFT